MKWADCVKEELGNREEPEETREEEKQEEQVEDECKERQVEGQLREEDKLRGKVERNTRQ